MGQRIVNTSFKPVTFEGLTPQQKAKDANLSVKRTMKGNSFRRSLRVFLPISPARNDKVNKG